MATNVDIFGWQLIVVCNYENIQSFGDIIIDLFICDEDNIQLIYFGL